MKKDKIFIQIASYRDPELLPTIKSCIENAKYPENLVFSISWQHAEEDEWDDLTPYKADDRFKIIDINYLDSDGVCWARNLLQQQFDDEEYTLQLDSHHRFAPNWDEECIAMIKNLQEAGWEKPLLTAYIPSYNPDREPDGREQEPWRQTFDRFAPEGVVHTLPESMSGYEERNLPEPTRFYSGHFTFGKGTFVKEVPHDPNYYFHGEEISLAVRAYTWGYDLFHPHKVVAWHEYTRKGKSHQWDDVKKWHIKNDGSFKRNRVLFGMEKGDEGDIDLGQYGFGTVRPLSDYEKYSGISFGRRSVQQYTLDKKVPPNPVLSDEEYESSFVQMFKHCIDVGHDLVPETDYDFPDRFWNVRFYRR